MLNVHMLVLYVCFCSDFTKRMRVCYMYTCSSIYYVISFYIHYILFLYVYVGLKYVYMYMYEYKLSVINVCRDIYLYISIYIYENL